MLCSVAITPSSLYTSYSAMHKVCADFYMSGFETAVQHTLTQAGGGRNEVDPRFISLFCVFNVTFPSTESLFHIYSSILSGHLQPFKKGK